MCTKFGQFILKFNKSGVHFSRLPTVSDCWRISNTHRKKICRLASSQKLRHGYAIRLTHIFAACNSHKHRAIPKTIAELKDALQQIWTALLRNTLLKVWNTFPSGWGNILDIKYDQCHNSYWWTLLPYDFIVRKDVCEYCRKLQWNVKIQELMLKKLLRCSQIFI